MKIAKLGTPPIKDAFRISRERTRAGSNVPVRDGFNVPVNAYPEGNKRPHLTSGVKFWEEAVPKQGRKKHTRVAIVRGCKMATLGKQVIFATGAVQHNSRAVHTGISTPAFRCLGRGSASTSNVTWSAKPESPSTVHRRSRSRSL
jgi:hypothetical protein